MNLNLSDEQEFLREAARGALSRFKTVEAAREALEDEQRAARPVADGHRGRLARAAGERGARRRGPRRLRRDARGAGGRPRAGARARCSARCPRRCCWTAAAAAVTEAVAGGELKAAWLPARPPSSLEPRWTVDPVVGQGARGRARRRPSTATA